MSDRRPCRNDEGWRMCRLRWWLADRFRGRKMFNRMSHPNGGYFIEGGRVDLEAIRARKDEVEMEIRIFDEDGA